MPDDTPSTIDPADRPVWGASQIASIIRRTERAAFHLLEGGHLDAKKVAGRWTSTPRRLLAGLAGGDDA
jgi:hypothetical protein